MFFSAGWLRAKGTIFIDACNISYCVVWMARPHNLLTLVWLLFMQLRTQQVTGWARDTAHSHHLL